MGKEEETHTSADNDTARTGAEDNENGKETAGKNESERSYSEEDVNRIVEKRLARERRKYAELIAGNGDDRETKLLEREKAVTTRELKADAREKLAAAGLPVAESLELLDYTDSDACEASIKKLKAAFDKAISEKISATLRGGPAIKKAPQGGADPIASAFKPPRMY